MHCPRDSFANAIYRGGVLGRIGLALAARISVSASLRASSGEVTGNDGLPGTMCLDRFMGEGAITSGRYCVTPAEAAVLFLRARWINSSWSLSMFLSPEVGKDDRRKKPEGE